MNLEEEGFQNNNAPHEQRIKEHSVCACFEWSMEIKQQM